MGKKKKAPVAIVTTSNEDSALQIQPPALDIDQLYSDLALSLECPLCLEALKDPVIFCPNGHSCCSACLARYQTRTSKSSPLNCPVCSSNCLAQPIRSLVVTEVININTKIELIRAEEKDKGSRDKQSMIEAALLDEALNREKLLLAEKKDLIKDLEKRKETYAERVALAEAINTSQNEKIKQQEQLLKIEKEKLKLLQDDIASRTSCYQVIEGELESLKESHTKVEKDLKAKHQASELESTKLKNELEELKVSTKWKDALVQSKTEEIEQLQASIKEINKELENSRKSQETHLAEAKARSAEATSMKTKIDFLKGKIIQMENEAAALKREHFNLNQHYKLEQEKATQLQGSIAQESPLTTRSTKAMLLQNIMIWETLDTLQMQKQTTNNNSLFLPKLVDHCWGILHAA